MKRSLKFRLLHFIHNVIAHPLLVVADVCSFTVLDRLAKCIERFHDATSPDHDAYNVRQFNKEA